MSQFFNLSFYLVVILSISNIFYVEPLNRTSIDLALVFSLIIGVKIALHVIQNIIEQKRIFLLSLTWVDILVIGYLAVNTVSLILTPVLFQGAHLRSLGSAIILYFYVRLFPFSKKQKQTLVHILGGYTVILSLVGLAQFLFPSLFNDFADKYFYGTSFSTYEFNRGRLLPWGYIVTTSPFFFSSILYLNSPRFQRLQRWYLLIGTALLTLVVILSNYRWLSFCILAGYIFFNTRARKLKDDSYPSNRYSVAIISAASIVALFLSGWRFGYTIVDRVALRDKPRDVQASLSRFRLFEQAYLIFTASPLVGIGKGSYMMYDAGTHEPQSMPPHNIFLEVLAEEGLLGFLFFSVLSFLTIRRVLRVNTPRSPISLAIFTSLLTYYAYNSLDTLFANSYPYLFFLIAAIFTFPRD